jgi:hypothetical protein
MVGRIWNGYEQCLIKWCLHIIFNLISIVVLTPLMNSEHIVRIFLNGCVDRIRFICALYAFWSIGRAGELTTALYSFVL